MRPRQGTLRCSAEAAALHLLSVVVNEEPIFVRVRHTLERVVAVRVVTVLVSTLVLVAACSSGSDDPDRGSAQAPSSDATGEAQTPASVRMTANQDVTLQVANLIMKVIRAGSTVEALCYASQVPVGYPGPVAQVRSGRRIGYVIVEVDDEATFNLTGRELAEQLPSCERVGLS